VALEPESRRQQVGEGHFAAIDDVPTHAITVTIPALLRATRVLVIAPEARKAKAVHEALYGPVTTACPASILRRQPNATLYLDADSSALLEWGRPGCEGGGHRRRVRPAGGGAGVQRDRRLRGRRRGFGSRRTGRTRRGDARRRRSGQRALTSLPTRAARAARARRRQGRVVRQALRARRRRSGRSRGRSPRRGRSRAVQLRISLCP